MPPLCLNIDSRPSKTKAQDWKVVHYIWWCPSVRTYVRTIHTDQRDQPFVKLVVWLVMGRGSLYDSSLGFSESLMTSFTRPLLLGSKVVHDHSSSGLIAYQNPYERIKSAWKFQIFTHHFNAFWNCKLLSLVYAILLRDFWSTRPTHSHGRVHFSKQNKFQLKTMFA